MSQYKITMRYRITRTAIVEAKDAKEAEEFPFNNVVEEHEDWDKYEVMSVSEVESAQ